MLQVQVLSERGLHVERSGRLFVEACAMTYGVSLTPEAVAAIHEIIRDGVSEMETRGETETRDKIFQAQGNLVAFMHELVNEAERRADLEIDRQHVMAARASFCPVYPFS